MLIKARTNPKTPDMQNYMSVFPRVYVLAAHCWLLIFAISFSPIMLDAQGNPMLRRSTTRAVIVGISDYQNISSLDFAHRDAEIFYQFLKSDSFSIPSYTRRKCFVGQLDLSEFVRRCFAFFGCALESVGVNRPTSFRLRGRSCAVSNLTRSRHRL